jgi:hypothetical protein
MIVGIENVAEEEYNQFDEIPPFDTSYKSDSWELTKHRTFKVTIVKKSIYRNQGRKNKPDFYLKCNPFCNIGCDVLVEFESFFNIFYLRYCIYSASVE